MEASPPAAEVACETTDLIVEASPPIMEVALDAFEDAREITLDASSTTEEVALLTTEDTKLDARLRMDEAADSIGLPVGRLTPPVRVSPGTVRVPPGSPTETPTLPRLELEEGVGLIETTTEEGTLTEELLGLPIEGSTTELKVGNWPFLLEVEPCLTPPVAEDTGLDPREAELLALELLALELLAGLTELALELLTGLTELALELLTVGLLELFKVGIEIGSLKELLDLVETLALLVAGLAEEVGFLDDEELVFFEDEDELGFLLLEGTTGFLLDEDDFADDEVFLLEETGLTVTVDFLVEEAGLAELVNFKMLERVSFLLETGLTAVDAFFELLLDTLALLVAFLVLVALELVTFLELVDTFLVLEDFLMEVGLGMEKVVVGLTGDTLAVTETPRVAETPTLRRGSRLSRTLSATSPKFSSLLSLEFKGAAKMRAGAKRPRMAA